jgi:hypothetical protein
MTQSINPRLRGRYQGCLHDCKNPADHHNPDNICGNQLRKYNKDLEEEIEYAHNKYPGLLKQYEEKYKVWHAIATKEYEIANMSSYYYYYKSLCIKCGFSTLLYPEYFDHTSNVMRYPSINLAPYNAWLRTHYKAIFSHIIKHDQLNYIIQNTETYTDLHKLFADSGVFPMDAYNEFEFMLMLAFLGNNGKPHNLCDEIILNPDW